jgi:peptidoglycan hydrolase-like protein with peptidoglycan-binding domain
MPAPLGKTPTKKMPKIEVFGLKDSQSTRAAVRFFRERRIVVSFVDLRAIDPAELRRLRDRLGPAASFDGVASTGAGPIDVNRLRLPLVRYGDDVTAGPDETTWKAWLARRNTASPTPRAAG